MSIMNRREFFGAAASGIMIMNPELVRGSARNSAVRMALFGCGGRGTGVAESFSTETDAQYVALGDLFQEQTEKAQQTINKAAAQKGKAAIASGMLSAQSPLNPNEQLPLLLVICAIDGLVIPPKELPTL